jgi:transcriptional regulator with XRE-family HTH domain
MPLSSDIIRERLRMTFGSESQEVVAGKLNMSQGNVSKLLSGSQMPALDTLYSISEKYGVSVDWLLGISEQKKIQSTDSLSSYSVAVAVITCVAQRGAKVQSDGANRSISLEIEDPILKALIRKSLVLSKTDSELYADWEKTKLSLFDDKTLIWSATWHDQQMAFLASEASIEADWLEVWEAAKKAEADYEEMMSDCLGPFGR